MTSDKEVLALCDVERQTAFEIHTYFRHGFLQNIYERALEHRLLKKGVRTSAQYPLKVYDEDDFLLGEYFADLFVDDCLIVELKACKTLNDEHYGQIIGYMKAARLRHGMLINFGSPKIQIKKFAV